MSKRNIFTNFSHEIYIFRQNTNKLQKEFKQRKALVSTSDRALEQLQIWIATPQFFNIYQCSNKVRAFFMIWVEFLYVYTIFFHIFRMNSLQFFRMLPWYYPFQWLLAWILTWSQVMYFSKQVSFDISWSLQFGSVCYTIFHNTWYINHRHLWRCI